MKIWNIEISWHRHKYRWKIDHEIGSGCDWEVKLVQYCTKENCNENYYKDMIYIYCRNRPSAYFLTS